MNTRDACDVCGRTTQEMHYVAVARKLLCSRCWRELSRRSESSPTGQLEIAGIAQVQPQGAHNG
jgi:recombinational DNA repair protein (RecF pathway)